MILASLGWRAIFIVFGLATLIWLVPWRGVVNALPSARDEARQPMVPVSRLLRSWALWAMGIGHAAGNYGFYFLLAWLPLFLVQQRGFSIQEMTLLASLGYGVQAAAALTLGSFSDRWTRSGRSEAQMRRWMLAAGQLLMAGCIAGIGFSTDTVTIGVLLCLAGVASASLSMNLYSVAQMFAGPRAAGTWIGVQNAVGNISGILGPIVSGILIDQAGYGSAFYLAAAIAAFGALWWVVGVPRIREIVTDQY
jgi:predicted MFS family arabinose efflux permease